MKTYNRFEFPFCPVPCGLLGFFSAAGQPQVMAVGWMGVVCSRPAVLSVTLRHSLAGGGLSPGDDFCINLPREEFLIRPALQDLLAGAAMRRPEDLGLTLQAAAATGGALLAECPVKLECRRAVFSARGSQELVSGEVMAVHLDGEVHGLDAPVDLCRLRPFASRSALPAIAAAVLPGSSAGAAHLNRVTLS